MKTTVLNEQELNRRIQARAMEILREHSVKKESLAFMYTPPTSYGQQGYTGTAYVTAELTKLAQVEQVQQTASTFNGKSVGDSISNGKKFLEYQFSDKNTAQNFEAALHKLNIYSSVEN